MTPTSCSRCPSPAMRTTWGEAWCERCYALVTAPIRAREHDTEADRLHPFAGIAIRTGYDHELGMHTLACDVCKAGTWSTDGTNEWCWYCHRAHLRAIDERAKTVLVPPDVDPDDERYGAVMGGWIDRMTHAVEAGIITRDQSRWAWERTQRGHGTAA